MNEQGRMLSKANLLLSLLLFTLVAAFFSALILPREFFFYWDEWSLLRSLAYGDVLNWLLQTHMGHSYVLGKLVYGAEVALFGEEYRYYLLVSIFVHALTTSVLFLLLKRLISAPLVPFLLSMLYGVYFAHIQNLVWAMQVMLFLYVFLLLVACHFTLSFIETGKRRCLFYSSLLSVSSIFFFGIGLTSGALNVLLAASALKTLKDKRLLSVFLWHFFATIIAAAIYILIAASSDQTSNHIGAAVDSLDFSAIPTVLVNPLFHGFLARAVFALPFEFLAVEAIPGNAIVWVSLVSYLLIGTALVASGAKIRAVLFGFLVFFLANTALMILPALNRYPFGVHAAFAYRYQAFALLPSVVALGYLFAAIFNHFSNYRRIILSIFIFSAVAHIVSSVPRSTTLTDRKAAELSLIKSRYFDYKSSNEAMSETAASEIFLPEANPELTKAEVTRIIELLF